MQQEYLIHEHHPRLLVFFAGWAADATPFRSYRPAGCDLMICYDYRSLEFDASVLEGYREVNVVGWSMGVWAATRCVSRWPLRPKCAIAINGTPWPIDDRRGIPAAIYQGTLDGLSGASLHKFLRRMCADSAAFRAFLEVTPRRPLEELREELADIAEEYGRQGQVDERRVDERQDDEERVDKGQADVQQGFCWTEAVVGGNDRIIPPANQEQAWLQLGIPVRRTEDAHYQESLFRHYLQDRWTND